jgi:hypothetical protein
VLVIGPKTRKTQNTDYCPQLEDEDDDEYEYDLVAKLPKEKTFWGEAVVYSSTGFDSALIIKTSETAAVTMQKASQR